MGKPVRGGPGSARSPEDGTPGRGKKLWQGRRARGRLKRAAAGGPVPSLHRPWQQFRFGEEHAPLAPPPSGGYTEGGGGVAGAMTAARTRLHLSREELLYVERLGLETNVLTILERLQAWDAKVAMIVEGCAPKRIRTTSKPRAQTELFSTSKEHSPSAPSIRRRTRTRSTR